MLLLFLWWFRSGSTCGGQTPGAGWHVSVPIFTERRALMPGVLHKFPNHSVFVSWNRDNHCWEEGGGITDTQSFWNTAVCLFLHRKKGLQIAS